MNTLCNGTRCIARPSPTATALLEGFIRLSREDEDNVGSLGGHNFADIFDGACRPDESVTRSANRGMVTAFSRRAS